MSLFKKQRKQADLSQVTAIRDRVWAMRQQMLGRRVELTDLFAMMGEDERKLYWDRGTAEFGPEHR